MVGTRAPQSMEGNMLSTQVLACCLLVTGTGRTELVEFTAPWCGACRQMDTTIDRLARAGLPVRQINVDLHRQWAERLKILRLPTFVVISNGKEMARIEGKTSYERLIQLFQQSVPKSNLESREVVRSQSPQTQTPADRLGNIFKKLKNLGQPMETRCRCNGPCQCDKNRHLAEPAPTPTVAQSNSKLTSKPTDSRRTVQAALRSTVRLKIEDPAGFSYGTGTIVDVHGQEALVLTCGHIFRLSQGVGRISCDLFIDENPKSIPAKLVSYDIRRDLGLVSIRPGVPVAAIRVGGTGRSPREGDRVFAIGCDRGAGPTVIQNRVLAVNRYLGPANLVVGGRPIDGRSGGGLYNQQGVLIGVCNAADQVKDEGLYAALGPIHAELDAANLGHLYRSYSGEMAPHMASTVHVADGLPHGGGSGNSTLPVSHPQSPDKASNWSPVPIASIDESATTGVAATARNDAKLDTEVICIVRSRDASGKNSQVMVLEHPSPKLLDQLNREMNRRGPHVNTDHQAFPNGTTRRQ